MTASNAPMTGVVRAVRIYSIILMVGGLSGCIAGIATGDAVPMALGAIASACGVFLAVFALLAGRKGKS
ncbi:hypothetical protein ACFWQ6_27595 [Streptomyces coelicoflavus]|uniref:hypothetical protein n=1 Tax=Streptomyces coelicoflavus TaxID=285562 RepID=UPI00365698BE